MQIKAQFVLSFQFLFDGIKWYNQQSMQEQQNQGSLQEGLIQAASLTDDVYFVPPPIHESNKSYIQQLEANQNSIKNLTKNYSCFNEVLPFDFNPLDELGETNITPEVKGKLKEYNLAIYNKMRQLLASVVGDTPAKVNADVAEIRRQVVEFIKLCGGIKVYETRLEIYSMMANETNLIKQRTAQITGQFQQIKQELKRVTANQTVSSERME